MELITLAKESLDLIQQIQPHLDTVEKTLTTVVTIGSSVGKILQQGQQLYTYLFGKRKASPKPATLATVDAWAADAWEMEMKQDVAILVDINQRMLLDVAAYLDEQQIDANLIIVTNDPAYGPNRRFLDPTTPAEWAELVQEFYTAIGIIQRYTANARLHFFLSTPLPLAFGLGAVWGTVDDALVYHWQNGTYYPAMAVSRALRSR